jgi:predicted nucleic acid-binding protein
VILDSSAAVDYVLDRRPTALWVVEQLESARRVRAPHVIDPEVVGALRRMVLRGRVSAGRATLAVDDFAALRLIRFPHKPLLARVWELRNNVSAADGFYVALAEALDAPLVTTDTSLARAPGLRIEIRSFA